MCEPFLFVPHLRIEDFRGMGYVDEVDLINSRVFLPQRRLRLWCVFIRKDMAAAKGSISAFRFCAPDITSQIGISELNCFLDMDTGRKQVIGRKAAATPAPTLRPLEGHAQFKWPKHTATFLKKNALDKKVMAHCLAGLEGQENFSKLSAREQRLLLAHYTYAFQKRKWLGMQLGHCAYCSVGAVVLGCGAMIEN